MPLGEEKASGSEVRYTMRRGAPGSNNNARQWMVRERDSRTTQRSHVSITVNANVPSNHILHLHKYIVNFPLLLSGILA